MVTKNLSRPTASQTERLFWREAFLVGPRFMDAWIPISEEIRSRADFADAAVQELRRRLTWRNTHDQ